MIGSIELGDWPGATLTIMDCQFPDAVDGGSDLVLPVHCPRHGRSIYWCPNMGVLWCDGGPVDWPWHRVGVVA
jgi:hypothetical protein